MNTDLTRSLLEEIRRYKRDHPGDLEAETARRKKEVQDGRADIKDD